MSSAWYYTRDGQAFGPYSSVQLRELARQGKLTPSDLVSREGALKWVPASTIDGLFAPAAPAAPPPLQPAGVTARPPAPAGPPPLRPAGPPPATGAGRKVPSWAKSLLALPKPILFGLFGGTGGFLGALILGELLWLILSPRTVAGGVPLQVAVSSKVQVYVGGKNTFTVKVARLGFSGPVTIEAQSPPSGVSIPKVEIPEGKDGAEVEVVATDTVKPGKHAITIQARAPDAARISPVTGQLELTVTAVPPGLAVVVSPLVTLEQGDKGRFSVRVARANFEGDVVVRFTGAPADAGMREQVVIPAGATEATGELAPPMTFIPGSFVVKAEASAIVDGKPVGPATSSFTLEVKERLPPKVDVVFVLDLTGSMGFAINGIKTGIQSFAEGLERDKIDARIAMVCFRDIDADKERPYALKFNGETFTRDYRAFRDGVAKLYAGGGGDEPESSLQGLALAAQQPFRDGAQRVLVFITDASPKLHRGETPSTVPQTVDELANKGITQLHLVVRKYNLDYAPLGSAGSYKMLHDKFPGSFFDITRATGGNAFKDLLPKLSTAISKTIVAGGPKDVTAPKAPELPRDTAVGTPAKSEIPVVKAVQASGAYAKDDLGRLLVAVVVWTMVIAAAISMFIVAGQQFHTRQSLIELPQGLRAFLGGLPAGIAGGLVVQLIYQWVAGDSAVWVAFSRILGWSLLGALIGAVMAFFVPNLKWTRGALGGVVGGFLGVLAFIFADWLLGDLPGRLLGATILGFCIGFMVALAEVLFRRWWLEIAVSPREIRTVTLGGAPVTLGGDERRASFYVAGAPPVALRYRFHGETVLCDDATTGTTMEVPPGDRRMLGKVTITVCSPASTQTTGYALALYGGRTLHLQEGMPLTAEDLPGLLPQGQDGMVALVARPPSLAKGVFLLRNRSQQSWKLRKPDGTAQVVDPGRGVELGVGLQFNFGQVQGVIQPEKEVAQR